MGFVSKVVGSITGANKAAKAQEEAARVQAEAIRASAATAASSAREAAAQSARQQEAIASRNAAEGAANDALSQPLEVADVQLEAVGGISSSAAANAKKRRQSFGIGSSSGVNI